MSQMTSNVEQLPTGNRLAEAFLRFGRIGFWLQLVIGSIPVALLIYAVVSGSGLGTRRQFSPLAYLTTASLLVLVFTTFWFLRYIRIGRQLAKPDHSLSASSIQRTAWIGVWASTIGITLSVLVMLFEVAQLLLYFLRAPQAGVPVVQTTSGGPASLMGLIATMTAEIAVLAMSLWLLFLTTSDGDSVGRSAENRPRRGQQ
jgi:lysylphosphatidylglycerol synthetase-like protein (DUF2156 family)